jgi:hypothetical protein
LPTAIITDAAMQRCPAQPDIDATTFDDVISGSASGITMRWFFAPPSARHALEVRAAAVDDLRHLRRADEADRLDVRVVADRFDRLLAAVHDVQHAVGQAGFAQQLGDAAGAERHQLGRLEDHAVAEGDRVGDRPVGHHVREVERRDRATTPTG